MTSPAQERDRQDADNDADNDAQVRRRNWITAAILLAFVAVLVVLSTMPLMRAAP